MKALTLLFLCGTMSACTRMDYAAVVSKKYPEAEITDDESYNVFIVRKEDGSVWKMVVDSNLTNVKEAKILPATRPK